MQLPIAGARAPHVSIKTNQKKPRPRQRVAGQEYGLAGGSVAFALIFCFFFIKKKEDIQTAKQLQS
jgi:hypothetical protein